MDGRLRRKGFAPPDAFAGKVVWITGASQVPECVISGYTDLHRVQ